MATVTLIDEAREQLSQLPRLIALRTEKLLTRLGHYIVVVERIGHRDGFYEE